MGDRRGHSPVGRGGGRRGRSDRYRDRRRTGGDRPRGDPGGSAFPGCGHTAVSRLVGAALANIGTGGTRAAAPWESICRPGPASTRSIQKATGPPRRLNSPPGLERDHRLAFTSPLPRRCPGLDTPWFTTVRRCRYVARSMTSVAPEPPSTALPDWPHCARGAAPAIDPVGCRGIQVDGHIACLAHLPERLRTAYLAGLSPGTDLDHRGTPFTPFTPELLGRLLDALRSHAPEAPRRRFQGPGHKCRPATVGLCRPAKRFAATAPLRARSAAAASLATVWAMPR